MEPEEKAEELATVQQSRRAVPRFDVDEDAHLLLVKHGSTIPCRIVDLSLSGCRVRTKERFPAGATVLVEVGFKVRGLAFRFSGTTQWTDGRCTAGIRFVDVPERRKGELVEALFEVAAENAAKAARQAAEQRAAEELAAQQEAAERLAAARGAETVVQAKQETPPQSSIQIPKARAAVPGLSAPLAFPGSANRRPASPSPPRPQPPAPPEAETQPAGPPPANPAKRERRVQSREEVDTSAVIHLINVGSWLQGRILDLSPNGCRVRTEERFPVGIYTRIETEFRLEGLPFRLGGVIQAIHDRERRNVGIRFLDMSSRKREQVEQLIQEIQELRERRAEGPGTKD